MTHSVVQGGHAGDGNLDTNPGLSFPSTNDDLVVACSNPPASCGSGVDQANDSVAPATDIAGAARVDVPGVGSAVADIGAHEFQLP